MKVFLSRILGFTLVAICLYFIFLFLVGTYATVSFRKNLKYEKGGYGFTFKKLKEVKDIENIDILILGSSHAYRGIDTRILSKYGFDAFNLGTSAQTPLQTEFLLETYLKKINPRIIIFEVYPSMFTKLGVESSLDIFENTQDINRHAFNMAFRVNNIKTYNFLAYSTLEKLFLNNNNFEDKGSGLDCYIQKQGYVERVLSYNKDTIARTRTWDFKKKQIMSFERILKLIESQGIELFLVQAPITKIRYENISNTEEVDYYFRKKGNYINFNGKISLKDYYDFYDSTHLNQNGAEKFTYEIIKCLTKNFTVE